jgi:hypothetical protein
MTSTVLPAYRTGVLLCWLYLGNRHLSGRGHVEAYGLYRNNRVLLYLYGTGKKQHRQNQEGHTKKKSLHYLLLINSIIKIL